MKKSIFIMAGALMSVSFMASAQEVPVQPVTTTTPTSTWDYKKNPTVDSINAKYQGTFAPSRDAMTIEKIFPVLGQYESSTNADAATVTVSMDAQSKGVIWVEGLPQGKVKAYLRQSPATYKIPAQELEDGKTVPEGTLVFDRDANTLSICIGKAYDIENPSSAFTEPTEPVVEETKVKTAKTKVKTKKEIKPWIYTGTKVETTTALMAPQQQ
jgi:hypothetical protein